MHFIWFYYRNNKNTHFIFNKFFFRKPCRLWDNVKNTAEWCMLQTTLLMLIAYRIPVTTDTHSVHVILTDFPPQQWLHQRASTLRYTYTVRFVESYRRILKDCFVSRISISQAGIQWPTVGHWKSGTEQLTVKLLKFILYIKRHETLRPKIAT